MKYILIILISIIILLIPFVIIIRVAKNNKYECSRCHHKFVPTYKSILMSLHRDTERYIKCPYCNKKSWCNEILIK